MEGEKGDLNGREGWEGWGEEVSGGKGSGKRAKNAFWKAHNISQELFPIQLTIRHATARECLSFFLYA